MTVGEGVREILARAEERGDCILCGAPAAYVGVFQPRDASRWPGPPPAPGKVRLIGYRLCADCLELTDRIQRVEAVLAAVPRA